MGKPDKYYRAYAYRVARPHAERLKPSRSDTMLLHKIFDTVELENEFWAKHPSAHMVKCIVIGDRTHIWYAESRGPYNGGHMVRGGADGDGTTYV